jgi:hypothetical protein
LPGEVFMTACSKPEDFVNKSTDLFFAALAGLEKRSPALAAAVVRRKSRRVVSGFILFVPRGFECSSPNHPEWKTA